MSEHFRKLEKLYLTAPTNQYYSPEIQIEKGTAEIRIPVKPEFFHAAHAVHGSVYFKALDDAAFFAANSMVEDVFVLTASFNIQLIRPVQKGIMIARGKLVHQTRRVLLADSELFDEQDQLLGRGSGSFMTSKISLGPEVGYL